MGKCVDNGTDRRIRYETPPGQPEATPRQVVYVTRKYKCSAYNNLLETEEEENLNDKVEKDIEEIEEEELIELVEESSMATIMEGWRVFMKKA